MSPSRVRALRSITGVSAALLLVAASLTWSSPRHGSPLRISLGTGGEGGVYHAYGSALAAVSEERDDTEVIALTTAASVENNRRVASGALDAAFTIADVAALAVNGEPPFEEPLPITAVARLYDNHTHVVVRADSPYHRVSDLAGTTVSVGSLGSGTEMMAERLLDLAGVPEAVPGAGPAAGAAVRLRLSVETSARALESGRVEAFFWSGGLPTQAVADLAERTPVRLIDLGEHVPELVDRYGDFFSELPVPTGTYPGVPAVRTAGVPSLMVVHRDMPDATAEALTRLLFGSRAELAAFHPVALQLHPRLAISTLPVPLHPGAAAYYHEVKNAHDRRSAERGNAPPGGSARRSRAGARAPGSARRPGVPAG